MLRVTSLLLLAASGASCATSTTTGGPRASTTVTSSDVDELESARPQQPPVSNDPVSAPTSSTATTTTTPQPGTPGMTAPRPPEHLTVGLLDGELAVEDAWDRWRAGNVATFEAAFEIAVLANRGRPVDRADELMVLALARAVDLSGCEPERLGKVRLLAIAVKTSVHPRELDSELTRLADTGPVECTRTRPTR